MEHDRWTPARRSLSGMVAVVLLGPIALVAATASTIIAAAPAGASTVAAPGASDTSTPAPAPAVNIDASTSGPASSLMLVLDPQVTVGDLIVVGCQAGSLAGQSTTLSVSDAQSNVFATDVTAQSVTSSDSFFDAIFSAQVSATNPDFVTCTSSNPSTGFMKMEVLDLSGVGASAVTGSTSQGGATNTMSIPPLTFGSGAFLYAIGNNAGGGSCQPGAGFTGLALNNDTETENATSGVPSPQTFAMSCTNTGTTFAEVAAAFGGATASGCSSSGASGAPPCCPPAGSTGSAGSHDVAVTAGQNLHGANLKGRTLTGTLASVDLQGANLQNANLSDMDLTGADLRGANLQGADLQCDILTGADASGANLQRANLAGVFGPGSTAGPTFVAEGSNFQSADLCNSTLSFASLNGSNFQASDMSGSDFDNGIFVGSNLQGANVAGANLSGADFTGANTKTTTAPPPSCPVSAAGAGS